MRLGDLKPLLSIALNLLGKSQKFSNDIMYPLTVILQIMHPDRGLDLRNLEKIHRWFNDPSPLWLKHWRSSGNINPVTKKDP